MSAKPESGVGAESRGSASKTSDLVWQLVFLTCGNWSQGLVSKQVSGF